MFSKFFTYNVFLIACGLLGFMLPTLAQQPTELSWWTFIEKIGFPGAVVIGMGYGLWKIARWSATEIFKPMASSHMALVESTQRANETNTEANMINARTNESIGKMLEKHGSVLEHQSSVMQHQSDLLKALVGRQGAPAPEQEPRGPRANYYPPKES